MTRQRFNPEFRIQTLKSFFSECFDCKITTKLNSRKQSYNKTNPFQSRPDFSPELSLGSAERRGSVDQFDRHPEPALVPSEADGSKGAVDSPQ